MFDVEFFQTEFLPEFGQEVNGVIYRYAQGDAEYDEDNIPLLEPRMLSLGEYAKFLDLIERL